MLPPPTDQPATSADIGVHVIGCGALVRELRMVLGETSRVDVTYLPAPLHNRPDRIVPAIQHELDRVTADHVVLGYGDCGTGGSLDAAIDRWRAEGRSIERLPGDHCYEFFTGSETFTALREAELGTLFLTDFLARNFDTLLWQGLGLADHPELLPMYFGNYTRVVFLSQTTDPERLEALEVLARDAADRLGLAYEHRPTGLGPVSEAVAVILNAGPTNEQTIRELHAS